MSESARAHLAMLTFSLLVSLSFFWGHIVAPDIDPGALMAARFALAGLVIWGFLRAFGMRPIWHAPWRFLLTGGAMALYFITMFEALRLTTAVSTAAVFTLTPIWAAGFGLVILGQRTGPGVLIALAIGAAGALWVIFRADLAALMAFQIGRGEAIFMIGVLAHGAVPALIKKTCSDISPLHSTFGTVCGAFVVTAIYAAPAVASTSWLALRAEVWGVLLYLVVFATAATFFLMQYASTRLPGPKVMAYTFLVPSWVLFWEIATRDEWPALGVALGVGGTILALLLLLRGAASE